MGKVNIYSVFFSLSKIKWVKADNNMPLSGPNMHMGHLAWGDAFIVTADSVSMISEACSTGYACEGVFQW